MSSLSEAFWEDVPGRDSGQGNRASLGPEDSVGWCGEKALIRGKGRAHEDPGTLAPLDVPEQWSVKATPSLALSTALHDHRPYPPSSLGDLEK